MRSTRIVGTTRGQERMELSLFIFILFVTDRDMRSIRIVGTARGQERMELPSSYLPRNRNKQTLFSTRRHSTESLVIR